MNRKTRKVTSAGEAALLWVVLFLMCFGLGYQTLNRYDPRQIVGLYDTRAYYGLVLGDVPAEVDDLGHRVLVPYLARPFYYLAKGRVSSWDPVFFGLLCSNAIFTATTVWLLIDVGWLVVADSATALLGGM